MSNEMCSTMDTDRECICCIESSTISRHRGDLRCATDGVMFLNICLSEEGVICSRFLFSTTIKDPEQRQSYLKSELTQKKWWFFAYKSFINLIPCQDIDMKVRYILPSCVVSAIRKKFTKNDVSSYTGFISLSKDDCEQCHKHTKVFNHSLLLIFTF